jgi:NDP-sugar pyrophosphorylase family protein
MVMPMDLVILAGGRGERISEFTKKIPKPLIKVNNIEFIQYLINFYSKYNFRKIFILTGYKGEKFRKFNKKYFNFIETECIREKNKLGTAGAMLQLRNKIKENFILVNGDSFINYDATWFIKKKLPKKIISKILLVKNLNYKSNNKLTGLKINQDKLVVNNGKLMNAGIYFFNKKIFKYLKFKKKSLENEIFPDLIKKKLVQGIYSNKKLLDIGTYANLNKAKNFLKKNTNSYSVFLDRDGVVNFDKKYVHKIKDFVFRKKVIQTLKFLNYKNHFDDS